jgi:hypothetical protein
MASQLSSDPSKLSQLQAQYEAGKYNAGVDREQHPERRDAQVGRPYESPG